MGRCSIIQEVEGRLEGLRRTLKRERNASPASEPSREAPLSISPCPRRVLRGHHGSLTAMCWAGDGQHMATVSQNGTLFVWDAARARRVGCLALASSWMLSCAIEQSSDQLLASGGLDGLCSVYRLANDDDAAMGARGTRRARPQEPLLCRLKGHDGYVSCCRFNGPGRLITSSGDSSCRAWDVERGECEAVLRGHDSDVVAVAVAPHDWRLFASASCDGTAKLWDLRTETSVATFRHPSDGAVDLNALAFFPSGNAMATAADDGSCHLVDARFPQTQLGRFERRMGSSSTGAASSATAVDFSLSGRWLFTGYEDGHWYAWDTVQQQGPREERQASLCVSAHKQRLTGLAVNRQGEALASASWDGTAKVWA